MKSKGLTAEIVLPFPIRKLFSYSVPVNLFEKAHPGKRVIVQFGNRKLYTGLIRELKNTDPNIPGLKPILEILDEKPLVSSTQMEFWDWLADYYMCSTGEIFKAALPSGLKLESESCIFPNLEFEEGNFERERYSLLFRSILRNPGITVSELVRSAGDSSIISDLRKLVELEAVFLEERIREQYQVKKLRMVNLPDHLQDEEKLHNVLDSLRKAPKQHELISSLIRESLDPAGKISSKPVLASTLTRSFGANALNGLVGKGYLKVFDIVEGKPESDSLVINPAILSKAQQEAFDSIHRHFQSRDVVLLHGVTSSGKTEIYIHLIREVMESGKQVLYLLPEIALTSQIINRLRRVFGDTVGVYHSRFSDRERVEVYRNLAGLAGKPCQLIIGVRSAVFLPFRNLGLIITDEEHENTYKQFDPAPRYNARDSAIVLAKLHHARVLLGSATPSLESYSNAMAGKYGLVHLNERFNKVKMPDIRISDIKKSRKRKTMKSVFTGDLLDAISNTLASGKQAILFQNRRGFSSYIMDESCGWIPKCKLCDVSLTYHRYRSTLECHYCGYSRKVPDSCEMCGSTRLINKGTGTEQVEEEIGMIFPGVRVARLDLDTSRSRTSYESILKAFGEGEIDILVGTQILSKGLDFENVALVGILDADQMMNFPDFRAYERAYQLMAQVSGRAGRKDRQGLVIIQSRDTGLPLLEYVKNNDYSSMFHEQSLERQTFNYPPFVRMIRITLKHRELTAVQIAAGEFAEEMRKVFGKRVLGPQQPLVGRISNFYLLNILLKIEKKASFTRARNIVWEIIDAMAYRDSMKGVRVLADVDPY